MRLTLPPPASGKSDAVSGGAAIAGDQRDGGDAEIGFGSMARFPTARPGAAVQRASSAASVLRVRSGEAIAASASTAISHSHQKSSSPAGGAAGRLFSGASSAML